MFPSLFRDSSDHHLTHTPLPTPTHTPVSIPL
jgi:hypothetical protein